MLDIKLLRNDFAKVQQALQQRGKSADIIQEFPVLDSKRRDLLQQSEQLKSRRNTVSQEVAKLKKKQGRMPKR